MTKIKPCPCCNGGIACSTCHATADMRKARLRCDECGLEIVKVGVSDSDAILKAAQTWHARWERTCHVLPYAPDYSQGAFDKDGRCSERGHIGYFKSGNYKHCPDCGAEVADE